MELDSQRFFTRHGVHETVETIDDNNPGFGVIDVWADAADEFSRRQLRRVDLFDFDPSRPNVWSQIRAEILRARSSSVWVFSSNV